MDEDTEFCLHEKKNVKLIVNFIMNTLGRVYIALLTLISYY